MRGLGSRLANTTGFSRRHRSGVSLTGLVERREPREPLSLAPSCEAVEEGKLRAGRAGRAGREGRSRGQRNDGGTREAGRVRSARAGGRVGIYIVVAVVAVADFTLLRARMRCCHFGRYLSLALRAGVGSSFEDVAIAVVDASVVKLRSCRSQQQQSR